MQSEHFAVTNREERRLQLGCRTPSRRPHVLPARVLLPAPRSKPGLRSHLEGRARLRAFREFGPSRDSTGRQRITRHAFGQTAATDNKLRLMFMECRQAVGHEGSHRFPLRLYLWSNSKDRQKRPNGGPTHVELLPARMAGWTQSP